MSLNTNSNILEKISPELSNWTMSESQIDRKFYKFLSGHIKLKIVIFNVYKQFLFPATF